MKNNKYLGRGIHKKIFLESLKNGNLKQMLKVINNDYDLNVQIRSDYLNIYYNGGSIANVKSENSIVFDEFYFYLEMKDILKKEIKNDKIIVGNLKSERNKLTRKFKDRDYKSYFSDAKEVMDKWLKINRKPERIEQHQLSTENQYNKSDYTIIDLEYQVSTKSDFACTFIPNGTNEPKRPRFDIIAVNRQGKLCVIELKKGTGSLRSTSGLKEHWDCFKQSIGRNHQSFVSEMEKLLEQKQYFNLIDNQVKIEYPIPEFMFAYSYDDKTMVKDQNKIFQEEYNKIGEKIYCIKLMKGSYKLLD